MQIKAKIIADSMTESGNRITTMLLTFPRFLLSEFNTHRVFSRNTSSSRAIPFEKMVKAVQDNPFVPIAWQKDHKGMQGTEYIHLDEEGWPESDWRSFADENATWAKWLNDGGVTKQLANRLLEPFMWTTVIVTATEWENFFDLRCPQYLLSWRSDEHPELLEDFQASYKSWKDYSLAYLRVNGKGGVVSMDDFDEMMRTPILERLKVNEGQAEIHMMALAEAMWDAYNESTPALKMPGDWHIPFHDQIHADLFDSVILKESRELYLKIATAMCARTSYTVVGKGTNRSKVEYDIKLHDQLLEQKHMSPFEHCAMVPRGIETFEPGMTHMDYKGQRWSGNLRGWIQYRHIIEQKDGHS